MDQTYRIIILNYVILHDILGWIILRGNIFLWKREKMYLVIFLGEVKNK